MSKLVWRLRVKLRRKSPGNLDEAVELYHDDTEYDPRRNANSWKRLAVTRGDRSRPGGIVEHNA
jgi:hypothetical protein